MTYNDQVHANVYMRHVLEGRLLDATTDNQEETDRCYAILESLLEGPTGPKIDAEVVGLRCVQAVVTTTCTVTIVLPTAEVAYALDVDVTKGKITKPRMYLFAG